MSYRYNNLVKNPGESQAHLLAEDFFAFFGQLTRRVCLGGLCRKLWKGVKQRQRMKINTVNSDNLFGI